MAPLGPGGSTQAPLGPPGEPATLCRLARQAKRELFLTLLAFILGSDVIADHPFIQTLGADAIAARPEMEACEILLSIQVVTMDPDRVRPCDDVRLRSML